MIDFPDMTGVDDPYYRDLYKKSLEVVFRTQGMTQEDRNIVVKISRLLMDTLDFKNLKNIIFVPSPLFAKTVFAGAVCIYYLEKKKQVFNPENGQLPSPKDSKKYIKLHKKVFSHPISIAAYKATLAAVEKRHNESPRSTNITAPGYFTDERMLSNLIMDGVFLAFMEKTGEVHNRNLIACFNHAHKVRDEGNLCFSNDLFEFMNEIGNLSDEGRKKEDYCLLISKHGSVRYHSENFWVVSDFPSKISFEERNGSYISHCNDGPSIIWRDGWTQWHIENFRVDEQLVMRPETQTLAQIEAETNPELKEIRIQRFGEKKYLELLKVNGR